MRNKLNLGCLAASRGLDVRLPRTRALLLGLLLSVAGWLPPLACADVEIDVLGEMVLMEAGESEKAGRRSELEASMHSSLLQNFQEVTEGIRTMEAVGVETGEMPATQQNTAAPTAFPDSSAVVGRIFQMKVPNKMEDVYLGDIVKVSPSITSLFILFWFMIVQVIKCANSIYFLLTVQKYVENTEITKQSHYTRRGGCWGQGTVASA